MSHRIQLVVRTLRLAIKADSRVSLVIIGVILTQACSVILVALAQRWVVDGSGLGVTSALGIAVLVGALAHAASAAGNRIQVNLRIDLGERVDLLLSQEVLATTAGIATVEHLERADYLDRLALLRRGTHTLAASCWTVTETLAAMLSLGLSTWLLVTIHPALGLLALCSAFPLFTADRSQRLIRAAQDTAVAHARHEDRLHRLCLSPEAAKEIRVAGNSVQLSQRADRLWAQVTDLEAAGRNRAAAWQLAGWLWFVAGLAAAIAVVASLASDGRASVGDVVLVILLATRLRGQLSLTVFGFKQTTESGHVADHHRWLSDFARERRGDGIEPVARFNDGITLHGVAYTYPHSATPALRDLDLHLAAGSTVGLVGVNGAGKSTLVKLLAGMYQPTAGVISIDGRSLHELRAAGWQGRVSGTFQDFVKFDLRCREAVGVGDVRHVEDTAAVTAAIERAGAGTIVQSLPNGLETQLGSAFGGVELSHGQWQKLALARGLMSAAPLLLIFDEPSSALDPQTEHDLFERFIALSKQAAAQYGTVTVLVSHRLSTLHSADHIVVIEEGAVLEQGSHEALMAARGHYADLYTTQARGYL